MKKSKDLDVELPKATLRNITGCMTLQKKVTEVVKPILIDSDKRLDISEVKLRNMQPGDLGWIVSRHGEIYAAEYNWTQDFEILVSEIVTDFSRKNNPKYERVWIAEARGLRLGSIMVVRQSAEVAKLRVLLVEPLARGAGLGSLLVNTVIQFSKDAGYKEIVLWTEGRLASARKIYEKAGFSLQKKSVNSIFGTRFEDQHWSKLL